MRKSCDVLELTRTHRVGVFLPDHSKLIDHVEGSDFQPCDPVQARRSGTAAVGPHEVRLDRKRWRKQWSCCMRTRRGEVEHPNRLITRSLCTFKALSLLLQYRLHLRPRLLMFLWLKLNPNYMSYSHFLVHATQLELKPNLMTQRMVYIMPNRNSCTRLYTFTIILKYTGAGLLHTPCTMIPNPTTLKYLQLLHQVL